MQVILLDKVQNLGDLGDVVDVKSGFARNYLIPQKMAARASAENIKAFEAQKAELVAKAKESLAAAQARAEALKNISVTITANASPEGHLYGSVGPREISEKFTESGYPVDASEVTMGEGAIKAVGEYEITLMLYADVDTEVKVIVEALEEDA